MPRLPFRVFNLAGFLLFFFSNVVSSKTIHVDWAKHLFPIQICNSCSTSRHDILDNKRTRPSWLHLSSRIKSFISKHFWNQGPFFKVSRSHLLVECSSNPLLVSLYMVLCPSFLLIYQSQLLISLFHPIFL